MQYKKYDSSDCISTSLTLAQTNKINSSKLLNDKLLLINLMEKLITSLLSQTQQHLTIITQSKFNSKTIPSICLGDYLKRIAKYSHCSTSAYVISLIYIDRLQQRVQNFLLNHYCIHKLLISSIMLAVKYVDDFYYKNQYYAKIGGISRQQIDQLQLELLMSMNFQVFVRQEQFVNYLDKLSTYQEINLIQ